MNLWRALRELARGRWHLLALVLLPALALHLLALAMGFVVRTLLDTLAGPGRGLTGVNGLLGLLGLVTAGRICALGLRAWTSVRWAYFSTASLQRRLLEGKLFHSASRPVGTAETLNRLRDDVYAVEALPIFLIEGVASLVFAGAALFCLVRINAHVTLAVILPMLGVAVLAARAQPAVGRRFAAARVATESGIGVLGAVLGAAEVLRLSGRVSSAVARFDAAGEPRRDAETASMMMGEYLKSVSSGMVIVGLGVLAVVAAVEARAGRFSAGDFGLFTYLLPYVNEVTIQVAGLFARVRNADISLGRLEALAGPVPAAARRAPSDDAPAPFQQLRVEDLSAVHDSGSGVRNASFFVKRGEVVAVTGEMGSGKTTLLRSLLGLLPRTTGRVWWNDGEVSDPATFFRPPVCGYVPQVATLLSLSVRDNILLGRSMDEHTLATVVQQAVLEADLRTLQGGLESIVGVRGAKLSGGQLQRVAAARAWVREPQLFVLDDFASALDVETENQLWSTLMARPDRTVLVATHRRATLQRADRIIVLAGGKLVGQGNLRELLLTCPEMQRLWTRGQ